jgi:small basic protein (TIGR04137 family)
MSLHRSLKTKPGALNQHRNVLSRAERITMLTEQDRFDSNKASPLGLVKVASRKAKAGKKPKKVVEEGAEGAAAAATATPGAPAAAAPGAAAATPAAKPAAKPAGKAKG